MWRCLHGLLTITKSELIDYNKYLCEELKTSLEKIQENEEKIYEQQEKIKILEQEGLETKKMKNLPNNEIKEKKLPDIKTILECNNSEIKVQNKKEINPISKEPREKTLENPISFKNILKKNLPQNEQDWTQIQSKKIEKKKSRKVNYITSKADKLCQFTSVPKLYHLYIGRLDKEVKAEEIKQFLKENDLKVYDVQQIKSKYEKTRYSAFRIAIAYSEKEKIYDEELWGNGIILRKYTWPNTRNSNNHDSNDDKSN